MGLPVNPITVDSLLGIPKELLRKIGCHFPAVCRGLADLTIPEIVNYHFPKAFLNKHFQGRAPDLKDRDVEDLRVSFKKQMTPEQYQSLEQTHGSGMITNVRILLDMEKQIQNQDQALKMLWGCIAPKLETEGHITATEKEMEADEIRDWMNNPEKQALLQRIQTVDLSNQDLLVIPPEIGKLTQLRELNLRNNQIEEIPSQICSLGQLTVLGLQMNQIEAIPSEIENLTQLRELHLSFNKIKVIPSQICSLSKLQKLFLEKNQIQVIPPETQDFLRNLVTLDLSGNPVES